jgi:hypothetical protein
VFDQENAYFGDQNLYSNTNPNPKTKFNNVYFNASKGFLESVTVPKIIKFASKCATQRYKNGDQLKDDRNL